MQLDKHKIIQTCMYTNNTFCKYFNIQHEFIQIYKIYKHEIIQTCKYININLYKHVKIEA